MSLYNYDVKQQVANDIKNALGGAHLTTCTMQQVRDDMKAFLNQSPPLSFVTLKTLLTSKKSITEVHAPIAQRVQQIRDDAKTAAQDILEQIALQEQIRDDDYEKRSDASSYKDDLHRKEILHQELIHKSTMRRQFEGELLTLNAVLQSTSTPLQVHQHPVTETHTNTHQHPSQVPTQPNVHTHPNQDAHQQSVGVVHAHPTIDIHQTTRQRISFINAELMQLNNQNRRISEELTQIDRRMEEYASRRNERELRLQARLDLANHVAGSSVNKTLSPKQQLDLNAKIRLHYDNFDLQCAELIANAEKINYSIFINQLEDHLKKTSLTDQEKRALNQSLTLIKQHLAYENEAEIIQRSLNEVQTTLSNDRKKLGLSNSKLNKLKQTNPHLARINEELAAQNIEQQALCIENKLTRDKLTTPTLIAVGTTVLASIPLALTLAGVIPFFIAPTLLFTLVSLPPALLLVTTLGLGIAAITYAVKASLNENTIENNQNTIDQNRSQMVDNISATEQLERATIPELTRAIARGELEQHNLEQSLQQKQMQAEQALQQAKEVTPRPAAPANPPTFTTVSKATFFYNPDGIVVGQVVDVNDLPDVEPLTP